MRRRSIMLGVVVSATLGSCGGEDAAKETSTRCRTADAEIVKLPQPRSAADLRTAATRASQALARAAGSNADELPASRALARTRAALDRLAKSPTGDVFAREDALAAVEAHAGELRSAVDARCSARIAAGTKLLRRAHFKLAIAPLENAVDPAKVRLDDDSLLGTGSHLLFAVDQYKAAISQTLERAQTAAPPPAARAAYRSYLQALRRLGNTTSALLDRGRQSPAQAAALRRQAGRVDRAYTQLNGAIGLG